MVQKIEISAKTIVFTVVFLILLQILWISRDLIFALFLGFIFMSALRPAVRFLSKYRIPHILSIIIVFILFFAFFTLVISSIVPPLVQETVSFFKNLPDITTKNFPYISSYVNIQSLNSYIPGIGQNVIGVISGIFSNFIFSVSVLFFTFYFLLDENLLPNLIQKFFNEKQAKSITETLMKVQERMGAWVWGEAILMMTIGIMSYIGLSLLGIKYALPLAIIAGLLEALPMIGPIVSAIPALLVALATSWFSGLSVLALYFIIQQLENNLIVPLVMKKTVGINPLLTLIALTVGGKLGGLMGALLSVPVALMIEIVLSQALKERK